MTKAVWMLHAKKADFNGLAARFHISPITARIIRNRDITAVSNTHLTLPTTPYV